MPITHDLKTENPYFTDVWERRKTFEIRRDDRPQRFRVGDGVILREWTDTEYTGRYVTGEITYITDYAQAPNFKVLGLKLELLVNDPNKDISPPPVEEQLYGATTEDERYRKLDRKIAILRNEMHQQHQQRVQSISSLRDLCTENARRIINQDKEIAELRTLIMRIPKQITIHLDTEEN